VTGRFVAIELGDAALAVADDSGLQAVEPGYMVVVDGTPRFGADALPFLKRYPHLASTHHWRELATEPMARSLAGFSSAAAIAGGHLQRLWSRYGAGKAGVYFATPPWWGAGQLSTLAALSADLGIPVLGVADAAIAASRSEYAGRGLLHLDIGLHGLALTRIRQNGRASLGEREQFGQPGIESLLGFAAEIIARRFVECSRFDPLHDAEAEQALFDRLPVWLARLGRGVDADLEISTRSGSFTANLHAADFTTRLAAVCAPFFQTLRGRVADRGPQALLVQPRFVEIPGLLDSLLRLPDTIVDVLEPGAAALGLIARGTLLPAAAAGLVTALPWDRPVSERAPEALPRGQPSGRIPTHILVGHQVFRLGGRPFRIGAELVDGEAGVALDPALRGLSRQHCTVRTEHGALMLFDHSRFGTLLNGHRVEGAVVLEPGDVVTVGNPPVEFRLVTEAGTGGA
jgi:hypothetical protein